LTAQNLHHDHDTGRSGSLKSRRGISGSQPIPYLAGRLSKQWKITVVLGQIIAEIALPQIPFPSFVLQLKMEKSSKNSPALLSFI